MTTPFITHAFIAGALAPAFHGRVDLDKYDLGVAQAENFYVDFRGGLKSRSGTKFILEAPSDARMFEFRLRNDQFSIIVLVSNQEMRFVQDGALLLDGAGAPLVLSVPYTTAELPDLRAFRFENALYFTHPLRLPHKLILSPDATPIFSFNIVNFEQRIDYRGLYPELTETEVTTRQTELSQALAANFNIQTNFVSTSTAANNASIIYAIAAVDERGIESLSASPIALTGIKNYAVTEGSVEFSWTPVLGVAFYRLYRSIISSNTELDFAQPLGLIAETKGARFVDTNTSPDFTITPRRRFNPFGRGALLEIEVTAEGADYPKNSTVSITSGSGTGAILYPTITDGKVSTVQVIAGGTLYSINDTVTINGTGGTGATARIARRSPTQGSNPRVFTRFQQHGVYAGTDNIPAGIWGSRRGAVDNFDTAEIPTAEDPYFYAVDSTPVDPIEHLIPIRDGMLIFHPSAVERLRAEEGRAVTALSAVVEKQADLGASSVPPVVINDDVLFPLRQSTSVQALKFTFFQNSYTPQDISILASHYFSIANPITSMAWIEEPDKLLWVTQANGSLLALTYMSAENTTAWTRHSTEGKFLEALTINEPARPATYVLVERIIGGETKRYLECFMPRDQQAVEDFWCVDSGLQATFATAQSVVSGLEHLEGKTVSALADGDAVLNLIVSGGAVTLPAPANKITIGLPYECLVETLPLASPNIPIDGKRKRAVGTAVRLQDTRGLALGTRLDQLFEMKDRGFEDWGVVTQLRSDNTLILHSARWERDARLFAKQIYPLPATILGLVVEVEHGS